MLDTRLLHWTPLAERNSLNTIGQNENYPRARKIAFAITRLTKDLRGQNEDYCVENRLDSDSACAEKQILHSFDLQETFENKIETIVETIVLEIDGTRTARARKKKLSTILTYKRLSRTK